MAPSATAVQSLSTKVKRPIPPGIQTNGIHSSTSSPSPSMSAGRLPNSGKPPNSATSNGIANSSGVRSASRAKRETPAQMLGRGQRNSSVGLRSASIAGESAMPQSAEPLPYVLTEAYILKKYCNHPPSLSVHLHPTHFRFDHQESSFSYKSPMRIVIEHLKQRTVPHDLVEFFNKSDVPFYDGCMIVQIYDHKSTAPSQGAARPTANTGKVVPFSVHNYNSYITPSSYVPFPSQPNATGKAKGISEGDVDDKAKTAQQKDKENMPAPAFPGDAQRGKSIAEPKKPKVSTIVLFPTPLSGHVDLAVKAAETLSNGDGRRDSRQDVAPLSATVAPTPTIAVPPTPPTSMAPPAKRQKKNKLELNGNNIYDAEAQIALATNAPLVLEPVSNAAASAALLKSLAHPMHSEKPPSPKTRKRTVAEMAADEALAAEQEKHMLILDERLSSNAANAQGGGNPADGDGQAGGASFEPRFERFKALENIKNQREEMTRLEKQRKEETLRKERERLRVESEKRDADKLRLQQVAEARRRAQMAQAQGLGVQGQHAHPPANNIMPNGMQSQPQRFHNTQVSQGQISSPIVRNGTPQSHSSPTVNNMGNVPMQHSTSSMGGSPPRPGSVVNQPHPQMGAQGHGMVPQRSQQSHAGTPRMPNSTPHIASTPLNRQMSQTPRNSQASPVQGSMAQAQNPMMMPNGQMPMNPQQIHQIQQRQQQMLLQQRQQQAMNGMMNGQHTPGNAQFGQNPAVQAQMRMMQQQGAGINAQQYQMAMQNNMQNFRQANGQPMNLQQPQPQLQQQQQQQLQQQMAYQMRAQAMAQAQQQQAQAQAQGMGMQPQQQQQHMQMQLQNQIRQQAGFLYRDRLPQHQAANGGMSPEADKALRIQCQHDAQNMVRRKMAQQQMMQAQAGQQNMGMHGMQNGLPPGM